MLMPPLTAGVSNLDEILLGRTMGWVAAIGHIGRLLSFEVDPKLPYIELCLVMQNGHPLTVDTYTVKRRKDSWKLTHPLDATDVPENLIFWSALSQISSMLLNVSLREGVELPKRPTLGLTDGFFSDPDSA